MAEHLNFFNGNENDETRSPQSHDGTQTRQGRGLVVACHGSR
jgi:hypothetical protein